MGLKWMAYLLHRWEKVLTTMILQTTSVHSTTELPCSRSWSSLAFSASTLMMRWVPLHSYLLASRASLFTNQYLLSCFTQHAKGHSHFYQPWQFIIAFKSSNSANKWIKKSAETEILLHKRLHKTKNKDTHHLRYYDGSIQLKYQVPPKAIETNHCRKEGCSDYQLELHPPDHLCQQSTLGMLTMHKSLYHNGLYELENDKLHVLSKLLTGGCNVTAYSQINFDNDQVFNPVMERRLPAL